MNKQKSRPKSLMNKQKGKPKKLQSAIKKEQSQRKSVHEMKVAKSVKFDIKKKTKNS